LNKNFSSGPAWTPWWGWTAW